MNWSSFVFGFLAAISVFAIVITFLAYNILPEIVEQGVTDALADYEVTIQS